MATRQEIQIALDLIKAVNVPNDLLLSAAVPVALGEAQVTEGQPGAQTQRDMTVAERKANLATLSKQVRGYRDKCASFLGNATNRGLASRGLAALGVSLDEIEADIATIKTASDHMTAGAANADEHARLVTVGETLVTETPPLPLVRKG